MDLNKSLSVHPRLRKLVAFAAAVGVLAAGIYWSANWLAEWHYNEFTAPFLG